MVAGGCRMSNKKLHDVHKGEHNDLGVKHMTVEIIENQNCKRKNGGFF
jgi:hypothetical protein